MLNQTFTDYEVLIFDDGSIDDTPRIIAETAAADGRVRLAGSAGVGLVEALRRTIDQSNGELLARMDGDDISHPERLADEIALLDARPDIAVASCLIRHFVDTPDEPPSRGAFQEGMRRYEAWLNSLVTPDQIARDLLVESPLCHPSVVMRRAAYDLTAGYRDDGRPEDYGLWLKAARCGLGMAKVDRVLFYWRDRPDRLSRTDDRYHPSGFMALKMEYLEQTHLKARADVTIWGAGKIGRQWSRALELTGRGVAEFIDIDDKKIGRTIHGRSVIPPPEERSAITSDFILVAVGAQTARTKIRAHLLAHGFKELQHFVCVA